jgi:hypothetical protein
MAKFSLAPTKHLSPSRSTPLGESFSEPELARRLAERLNQRPEASDAQVDRAFRTLRRHVHDRAGISAVVAPSAFD